MPSYETLFSDLEVNVLCRNTNVSYREIKCKQ